MHAIYEFRVNSDYADRLFESGEGKDLGSVRVVQLSSVDPRIPRIGELQRIIHHETNNRRYFFAGWDIRYRYSKEELSAADALKLWPTRTFGPAGEECGTVYDESAACPECGAGAIQVSELRLDLRKAPKNKDIARTFAGETIVSQPFAELLTDGGFSGFELRPVRHAARYEDDPFDLKEVPTGREILQSAKEADSPHPTWNFWVWLNRPENRERLDQAQREYVALKQTRNRKKARSMPIWYQLVVNAPPVPIIPPTRTGVDPFDEDITNEYRCSRGHVIGLNLLSELWLGGDGLGGYDIACTRELIGVCRGTYWKRLAELPENPELMKNTGGLAGKAGQPEQRGLSRPEPLLVISPRLWRAMDENEIKGFRVDVAHLQ